MTLFSLSLRETFGLTSPLSRRWAQAMMAVRGDAHVPPSRFDWTSLSIFHPELSVRTWLGWTPGDGRLPVTNLFNRTPTPIEEGWSVRKTHVRDFRGGALTYDSHNGTDFGIPIGTRVVAPADGVVLRVSNELHRGGLKVLIDHGRGLVTTSNHLGRSLVFVGDGVRRGQTIALSAYSGLDAIVSFPWSVPHVHFNTWLNGAHVDPFAEPGETALWLDGNDPRASSGREPEEFVPTTWSAKRVDAAIEACRDVSVRDQLASTADLATRAVNVLFEQNYFPTRFAERVGLYEQDHPRVPRLTLPFHRDDYERVWFVDQPVGSR